MRITLSFLFLLLGFLSKAQTSFDKTKYDFGDIASYDDRFVDITVTNHGSKSEFILSVKKPFEVVYILKGKFIEKDSSAIVRLQVNPKVKGRFSYEIEIFTSDKNEATKIKLTGNLKEIDQNSANGMTACPDFSSRPGGRANNFDLTVITIDKQTRAELAQSKVTFIQNGQPLWAKMTDKNGKIKEDATLGFSYFHAGHDGYYPAELGAYINFQRNVVVIELDKKPEEIAVVIPPIVVPEIIVPEIVIPQEVKPQETEEELAIVLSEEIPTQVIQEIPVALAELDPNDFSETHFKPINVIFVLDVSASMKQGDKIELMKYAMIQLAEMMRPQDKMGIVTYASETQILMAPTSGVNQEELKSTISGLKASGYTSGGAGIKMGYKQALKSYMDDGTNQIIVITDGAFNRNSDDYKKYIKKYSKKGIQMSVVGIKNKEVDEQEMRDAATLGGGRYIPIFKLVDAQNNLKQEIRFISFKN